jgi:hypothetical protein
MNWDSNDESLSGSDPQGPRRPSLNDSGSCRKPGFETDTVAVSQGDGMGPPGLHGPHGLTPRPRGLSAGSMIKPARRRGKVDECSLAQYPGERQRPNYGGHYGSLFG